MKEENKMLQENDPAEGLIMTWYRWTQSHREFLGYPNVSPTFRVAKSGITHDEIIDREDRDARIARLQAEQVDACIDALPTWQMRSAVGLHAANKAAGSQIYRNPRMSTQQLHQAYQEAKTLLIPMFVMRGLMNEK